MIQKNAPRAGSGHNPAILNATYYTLFWARTEPEGKDVLDEAPQELHRSKHHLPLFIAMCMILPTEGHGRAVEVEQPIASAGDVNRWMRAVFEGRLVPRSMGRMDGPGVSPKTGE